MPAASNGQHVCLLELGHILIRYTSQPRSGERVLLQITANQKLDVTRAANKFMPGITWKENSVVIGDFTCRGRTEKAILGVSHPEAARPYVILAVFLDGINKQPEIIRDSTHNPVYAALTTESLDYDPRENVGDTLEGFQRSKTCKGLNIADGQRDSFHIYWNHEFREFDW